MNPMIPNNFDMDRLLAETYTAQSKMSINDTNSLEQALNIIILCSATGLIPLEELVLSESEVSASIVKNYSKQPVNMTA